MGLPGRHSAFKEAPYSGVVKRLGGKILQVSRACVTNCTGSCKAGQGSVTSCRLLKGPLSPSDASHHYGAIHCPTPTLTKEHPQKPRPPLLHAQEDGDRGLHAQCSQRNQTQTLPSTSLKTREPFKSPGHRTGSLGATENLKERGSWERP